MRLFASLALALSLTISFISPSLGHAHQGRRHHVHRQDDLVRRDPGEINLYKRFDNARFTYYVVGLGACGATNQPSDFIVALNSQQYNGGEYCFQMITITINGKTTQAQVMDECPGCPYAGLDFSQGLFVYFADTSVGTLAGTWNFDSGGSSTSPSPSPSPSPPPPPTTSVVIPITTWLPSPTTTTWQSPTTTTTSAPPTTSSSSSSSSTVSSSPSSLVPTQTTANVVAESAGAVPGGAVNSSVLFDVNLSVVIIGQFLSDCSGL